MAICHRCLQEPLNTHQPSGSQRSACRTPSMSHGGWMRYKVPHHRLWQAYRGDMLPALLAASSDHMNATSRQNLFAGVSQGMWDEMQRLDNIFFTFGARPGRQLQRACFVMRSAQRLVFGPRITNPESNGDESRRRVLDNPSFTCLVVSTTCRNHRVSV